MPGRIPGHPAQHPAGILLGQVPLGVAQPEEVVRDGHRGRRGMNRLLTTDEVADLLNVKPSTIRKWVHLEQIPVVRLGRAVRFRVEAVEKWVNERSKQPRIWD